MNTLLLYTPHNQFFKVLFAQSYSIEPYEYLPDTIHMDETPSDGVVVWYFLYYGVVVSPHVVFVYGAFLVP